MAKTYFVSRHAGAQDWAKRKGFDAQPVAHFDASVISNGDKVLGTLPVQIVADVIARGGTYYHLSMAIPADMRGKDLSADDMDDFGATLQRFHVTAVD